MELAAGVSAIVGTATGDREIAGAVGPEEPLDLGWIRSLRDSSAAETSPHSRPPC